MQFLALLYGIFIGIGLITGVTNLLVGLRRRPLDPVHLSFAIMTLLIAAVVLADSGYRLATTVDRALSLLNWGVTLTALALIALIWFVAFYTQYAPRRFLYLMSGLYLFPAIVSVVLPTGTLYAGDIVLESFTLPWGEPFVHVTGTPNNLQIVNIAIFLATFGYIFYAIVRQYRGGDHRAALTLLAGVGFIMAGTVHDFLLDFGAISNTIGLYPISYIGLIMVMSLGLADDAVRTGVVQDELLENERRMRTLLDGIEQLVVGLDRTGRVEYLNPYFEKVTGYDPNAIMGKNWFQTVIPYADRPQLKQTFAEMLENNFHRHYRNHILTAQNDLRIVAWSNVRLRDASGEISGSLSVGRDITEQLATQVALKRHQHELEDMIAERTVELRRANLALDRQRQAADRRRRTAEGSASILAALNTDQPLDDILSYLTEHADQLLGSDASMVVNATGSDYRVVATTAPKDIMPVARTLCQAAMRRIAHGGDPTGFSAQGLQTVESANGADETEIATIVYESVLAIPLFPQDAPEWGIVLLYETEQEFSREDLDNAAILQVQMLLAIENTELRARIADQAVARERNRLSRELHDSVTQNLYTISTLADVMPDLVESHPDELAQAAKNLRLLAAGALAEMRSLLLELQPTVLLEKNLGDLLQQLVDGLQSRTHTQITVSVMNDRVFANDVQIALYRIAQEALTNVIKHAAAEHAIVGLYCDENTATLRIQDDGRAFAPAEVAPDCFGLKNLQERARQIDAAFSLKTEIDQGTEISVIWSEQGQDDDGNQDRAGEEKSDSRLVRG